MSGLHRGCGNTSSHVYTEELTMQVDAMKALCNVKWIGHKNKNEKEQELSEKNNSFLIRTL